MTEHEGRLKIRMDGHAGKTSVEVDGKPLYDPQSTRPTTRHRPSASHRHPSKPSPSAWSS